MTVEFDDVQKLFRDKLVSVCEVHLAIDANGKYFTSIKIEDQLPGEDICDTIARHMVDALTAHET